MKEDIEITITVNTIDIYFFCLVNVLCSVLSLLCYCLCTVLHSVFGEVLVVSWFDLCLYCDITL